MATGTVGGAGTLDRRYRFEKRASISDGAGNHEGEWEHQFSLAGNRRYLRGGEGVLAARLTARQPVILTVRTCANARQITADWRAVDERAGTILNIREDPQESDSRGYMSMLAEGGVAT